VTAPIRSVRRPAAARQRLPQSVLAAPARRLVMTVLLGAALLGAVTLAAILTSTNDSAPNVSPGVTPLRVTAGDEIATGFALRRDRVVTVAHVLGGAVTVDGERARVIRVDRRSDLALLAVSGLTARAPAIAAHPTPAGSRMRVLRLRSGRPSSLSAHLRRAIVAHLRPPGAAHAVTRPALELGGRVAPGDSGAPVVSPSGELAGVIFAASRGRDDTAYAVDASAVTRLIARD
jgi:Trypsin-like peptidase domain